MKLACLFSGGKDSNFALYKASKKHDITCLVNLKSANPYSYMFQSVGNEFVSFQAEALDIPLINYFTSGEKEKEVEDLRKALDYAKKKYGIKGVVTGAIKSVYQATRVQRVCDELELWCFNPLWQIDEEEFFKELITEGFNVQIIGIFSFPLTRKHLGRIYDSELLDEFKKYREKYSLSLIGEGGETESFVLDSPLFKKKLELNIEDKIMESEHAGIIEISKIKVIDK